MILLRTLQWEVILWIVYLLFVVQLWFVPVVRWGHSSRLNHTAQHPNEIIISIRPQIISFLGFLIIF